jgi:choline-sulfatase
MSNMIILMSDEHNPFYSSVYGHPFIQTPNMQRLAAMGTVYRNTYSPSPLCLPCRSAFMAGRRVHEIETYSNCNVNLNPNFPSYGKVLSDQGVHTVHIGKTDVYDRAENMGFSELKLSGNRKLPGDTSFVRVPLFVKKGAASRANGFGVKEEAFRADTKSVDEGIRWLNETAPTLSTPWVLVVQVVNPHFPQWNTQEFWDMYPEEDLPKYGKECESGNHPYARDLKDHFELDAFTEEQARGIRRGYYGNVTFVDRQLGRLIDLAEERGLLESTNLVYTSDHGEMLGKFGLWWKCSLYEDSARVPLIAAGPGFTAGKVVETPVDLLDLQAAMFMATGAKRPADWSGTPLQQIPDNDPERVVFSEYHGHGTRSGAFLIRKGDWKLIYCMKAPHLLFNLKDDPDELKNVFAEHPRKALELEAELRKICNPEAVNRRAHEFQVQQWADVQANYVNAAYSE